MVNLCFADDLMIFCKGELSSIKLIKDALTEFEALSGKGKQKADLEQPTAGSILLQGDSSKSSPPILQEQQDINSGALGSESESEEKLLEVLESVVSSSHEVPQQQVKMAVMSGKTDPGHSAGPTEEQVSEVNQTPTPKPPDPRGAEKENLRVDCDQPLQSSSSPLDTPSNGEELSDSEDELLGVLEGVVSSNKDKGEMSQHIKSATSLVTTLSELNSSLAPEPPDRSGSGVSKAAADLVSKGSSGFNKYLSKSAKKRMKKQAKEELMEGINSRPQVQNN
ncbi:hypothetical protein RHGRI_001640 [Rhododendron griersonianum]|uniref:Uncharacterized protein n=1 Tax=Rhododendron griersonianum TaxID=479676 RepID=A0AAV6LKY1_9ERIC|nr:hypothetical protein RHGRI_001640 [Rhododendron griersonianum]